MVIKRGANVKRHYILTVCKHDMPQSLLVFAVSFTSETPSFGTFSEFAHPPPPKNFFIIFFNFAF